MYKGDICSYKDDESALVQVLEFLAVFTIFLLVLTAFFLSVSTQFPVYDTTDLRLRAKAEAVAEALISSPGAVESGDTNWEGEGYKEQLSLGPNRLVRLGLARDHDSYGILSESKIRRFASDYVDFLTIERVFALEHGMIINFTIIELDTKLIHLTKGGYRTDATTSVVTVTRIVLVDTTKQLIPCKLIINLMAGGSY